MSPKIYDQSGLKIYRMPYQKGVINSSKYNKSVHSSMEKKLKNSKNDKLYKQVLSPMSIRITEKRLKNMQTL